MDALNIYLCGALTALAFVIGVFFARYYVLTRDRFFVFLTITFWVLGANWASLASQVIVDEGNQAFYYLPRLAAFLVLLAGIADKNRRGAAARANVAPEPLRKVSG
jgi:hypothetical protein